MAQRGVNRATIIGNVGSDPELNHSPGGTAVTRFSVATNEVWKDSGGRQQERTEWHRIVAFGKRAEVCEKYLAKGSRVYIDGKIQTRVWEQDGQKRWSTEIVVRDVQFLSPMRAEGADGRVGGENGSRDAVPAGRDQDSPPFPDDDDLPF